MESCMRPESRLPYTSAMCRAETRSVPLRSLVVACLMSTAVLILPSAAYAQESSAKVRLVAAARAGDQAGVTRALAEGATPNARNRIGETALFIALKTERPDLARQMIDAGTDINLAAANGVTPLMAAAHAGNSEIVKLLLAKGADINAADRLKKNAMVYAAGQGHTDVVVLLLQGGIDPNAIYEHSLTALMWAAGYGRDDTVKALLTAGAKIDLKDDRGKTAV